MKNFTTLITASIACVVFVLLLAFDSRKEIAATSSPYILVEIYEIPSYPDRGVHIHYGNNKREFIPFKGMDVEHHDEAGDITLAAINKLEVEGYEIVSSSAGLDQAGMITKIFMRKK